MTPDELQAAIDATGNASPLRDLNPWDRNPRINDAASKKLAEYIRQDGWGAPIVAQKHTGRIIAGHTRWKAAHILGLERVPVHFVEVDDRTANRLALADNKLGEIADWNMPGLAQLLEEQGLENADLMGWDSFELEKLANLVPDFGPLDKSDEAPAKITVTVECDSETHMRSVATLCAERGWKWKSNI